MRIRDYNEIVGEKAINELHKLSEGLKDKRIIMINSTNKGGGVAEILLRLVPMLNRLGIKTEWLVLNGEKDFFNATKSFHNALQGQPHGDIKLQILKYQGFYDTKLRELNQHIIDCLENTCDSDIVVVHDPQPLNLIIHRKEDGSKWIWREHIDTSKPDKILGKYVYGLAANYDKTIVSKKEFIKGNPKKYEVIPPSIDPFTNKNKELSEKELKKILRKYCIPTDKPIISQISRLDKWKDPIGVIDVFKEVRKKINCKLILAYNSAADDPEGEMMERVVKAEQEEYCEDIILFGVHDDLLVNALQRVSDVVLQKSLKEGFALTVSEALWKKTPVVATKVGGIPLQIKHGKNGYLVKGYKIKGDGSPVNIEDRNMHIHKTAKYVIDILSDPVKRKRMGEYGKEIVRKNFLITRHAKDYLELFNDLYNCQKVIETISSSTPSGSRQKE